MTTLQHIQEACDEALQDAAIELRETVSDNADDDTYIVMYEAIQEEQQRAALREQQRQRRYAFVGEY